MPAKVTLIVPTYNRAALLPRALDSALAQDYPHLDIVVVDDGSTDGTSELLERYARDPRICVVRHETNRGVTAAKNTGLDHLPSDTSYFGILDSDDELLPTAVSKLVAVFEQSPGRYSQVFGWCQDPQTGARTGRMTALEGIIHYDDALCARFDSEFWQLVRTDLLGKLRFEERAAGGENSVWWRLLKQAPAWLIPDVVRLYHLSGLDRVNRPSFDPKNALRKMWAYRAMLESSGADLLAACPRRYATLQLDMAAWAALAGERGEALNAVRASFRADPSVRVFKLGLAALLPSPLLRRIYRYRYRQL